MEVRSRKELLGYVLYNEHTKEWNALRWDGRWGAFESEKEAARWLKNTRAW